jgi:type II secretory pathway pseudopilin PulG
MPGFSRLGSAAARPAEAGYAMAVLLVAMSISAVLMTVAMPVWKQATRRDKEAELVFRGEQYVRAIRLFQQRAGPGALPPTVNVLVEQRFLRHAFKDPITGEDFLVLPGAAPASGAETRIQPPGFGTQRGQEPGMQRGQGPGMQRGQGPGSVIQQAQSDLKARVDLMAGRKPGSTATSPTGGIEQPRMGAVPGGIAGVVSRSRDESLRVYNGRTHYNEWEFRHVAQTAAPNQPGAGPGRGRGDGRGAVDGRGGRGFNGRGFDGRGSNPAFDEIRRPIGPEGGFRLQPDGRGGAQSTPFDPSRSSPARGGPVQPAPPGAPPR